MAKLYAVGVGPGDPELLTRKAERILRQVDVVLAPVSRVGEDSVALETVAQFLDDRRQEIILHQFPMTAETSRLVSAWEEATTIIADRLHHAKSVAFITIGDPLLYSTFIYLLRMLCEKHPAVEIEIVPGISSIMTSAAIAGVPLAEGDERLAVIPATAGIDKMCDALTRYETVVLLKVKPLFAEILELLRQMHRQRCTVFVQRAGSAQQKVIHDFDELARQTPDYLSLMIVRQNPEA